jgi:hypothetical protein
MERFPKLKTGALAQYPAERSIGSAVETRRFVDSSEQRYLDAAEPKRSWRLDLRQLIPTELAEIREFFELVRGSRDEFEFEDPWTGAVVSPCRFGQDALTEQLLRENSESVVVTILEV